MPFLDTSTLYILWHGVVMEEGLVTKSHLAGDGSVNKKPN